MVTNERYADWLPDMLTAEIERDYQKEAEMERLCRQPEMLRSVEQAIGIFFAREDN